MTLRERRCFDGCSGTLSDDASFRHLSLSDWASIDVNDGDDDDDDEEKPEEDEEDYRGRGCWKW